MNVVTIIIFIIVCITLICCYNTKSFSAIIDSLKKKKFESSNESEKSEKC